MWCKLWHYGPVCRGNGEKDHALLLNTKTLDYEYIPITLCGVKLIIANSNKKHKLGESKYNERREECETALEEISQAIGIHALCDLDEKHGICIR